MLRTGFLVLLTLAATVVPAFAQPALGGCSKFWTTNSQQSDAINENHYRLLHDVEVDCNDMQIFADVLDIFNDADRVTASGNVVFVSNNNRISADRLEFNTRTRTGTFYVASGIANIENRGIDRSLFGTQEPDAYFWGKTIEKLGPKTYRITSGGFTTCVQPTPRWELVSDTVTLTLDEHAVLKNTVLKVKGVPLFYMPMMYYPINKEDRATGFLIPTYGTSAVKGQSISNAFFWAINRSQDATLFHDFFSKTGQGFGGEYRYVQAPGSQGSMRTYILHEHDTVYRQPNGTETNYAGRQSYQITGNLTQRLPARLRLTANANYFSSLVAQQRYQQNVYAATNTSRSFNANLAGTWGKYNLSGTVERNELFYSETSSNVYGSAPRVLVSRAESPIGRLPVYFGVQGEFVTLDRQDKSGTTVNDRGLTRVDVIPTFRFPFTKWQFLTFNSSVTYRATYWTESLVNNVQAPDPIGRRYFDASTRITGPVFTRIFSGDPAKPKSLKLKHVIEPTLTLQRISAIDNVDKIVKLDGTDWVVGSLTRVTYGLNNRLYAKKDTAREVLTVSLQQTYYTDARGSQVDRNYQSSFNTILPPSNFSPVALQVRVSPTAALDATFRTEYDTQAHALRTIAANGTWSRPWVQTTAGWSQRRFIPDLTGFNDPNLANNFVNAATTIKKPGNTWGGTYTFNYDLRRQLFLQQRYIAYYNSQCCGVAVEYQTFNFGTIVTNTIGLTQDHRFNVSFTLAGIGSFSNLFGAFGGQQGR